MLLIVRGEGRVPQIRDFRESDPIDFFRIHWITFPEIMPRVAAPTRDVVRSSQSLDSNFNLPNPLFRASFERRKQVLRHIQVRALVLHQGPQAICFDERRTRALPQCERLLDATQRNLSVSLAIGRSIASQLKPARATACAASYRLLNRTASGIPRRLAAATNSRATLDGFRLPFA